MKAFCLVRRAFIRSWPKVDSSQCSSLLQEVKAKSLPNEQLKNVLYFCYSFNFNNNQIIEKINLYTTNISSSDTQKRRRESTRHLSVHKTRIYRWQKRDGRMKYSLYQSVHICKYRCKSRGRPIYFWKSQKI